MHVLDRAGRVRRRSGPEVGGKTEPSLAAQIGAV